ncbi:hypothetical protein [Piscinibacter sp.]|jgi:hypothetical protein|uniref:hypothetical protein n=1 Tax=Piscinibacter sp. TaxID=1903157 RepID=UPI00355AC846
MRLSAPSEVEGFHLAPCPKCGALNGKTATLCWKCDVELPAPSIAESELSGPDAETPAEPVAATPSVEPAIDPPAQPAAAAPVPVLRDAVVTAFRPRKRAAPGVPRDPGRRSPPEAPSPPDETQDAAADEPAAPAAEPPEPIAPALLQPATPEAPPAAEPEHSAEGPVSVWGFVDSSSFADHAEAVRRQRRKMVSLAMGVVGVVVVLVVVSAYVVFREPAVADVTWPPAGTTEVARPGGPDEVGTRVDATAGATDTVPLAVVPGPAAANGRGAVAPPPLVERRVAIDTNPPAVIGAARGKAEARAGANKRGLARRSVPAPDATVTVTRPNPTPSDAAIEPPPPHPGPCSPAIAALGLCTPEPIQRRE